MGQAEKSSSGRFGIHSQAVQSKSHEEEDCVVNTLALAEILKVPLPLAAMSR